MKPTTATSLLWPAALTLCLAFLVNCSDVRFSRGSDASSGGAGAAGIPVAHTGSGDGTNTGAGDAGTGATNGGTDTANGTINQPGDVSNAGGDPGPITGVGDTPAAALPKVQFIGPPCIRLTNCSITFRLDKAYPERTEFDWKTNDALYGTPPNPGLPMWGQAGYHYVSTSGHVVFAPGEVEQTVYVRNINPDNVEIAIGVLMSMCDYNGLLESCQKFFAP
jgi:hypothetical protein